MIKLVKNGTYTSFKKDHNIILILDEKKIYTLSDMQLSFGHISYTPDLSLLGLPFITSGQYRLYNVEDEPDLTDTYHLEMSAQKNGWKGYLLLTGLPDIHHSKTHIMSTSEIISRRTNNSSGYLDIIVKN